MRFFRVMSLFLVFLFVVFCCLGIFIPKINYDFTINIQAPIGKAYTAMASHEMKPQLYNEIDPSDDKTKIEAFKKGAKSKLTYKKRGKPKMLIEEVIAIDSLKYLELLTETDEAMLRSKIYFTDKNLISSLRVKEEMYGRSFIERSYLVLMKSLIKRSRQQFYVRQKQIIESTPDYNFRPEDQK